MKAQDKGERQRLSDRQWDKIERASGLPSEARSIIESDIRRYLSMQELNPAVPPAKTREKLQKLRNQANELSKSFEEALRHDDVYFALVPVGSNEWHPRNLEQRKHLAEHYRTEKAKADLNALVDWLEQRERALSRRKPGPSADQADNVYWLVNWIDDVLHHYTNKRLARSDHHRAMMKEIFAIVDREVGMGTIDTAMRRVYAARRSRRGVAETLLPGSRV
jgi:hypothetical protein